MSMNQLADLRREKEQGSAGVERTEVNYFSLRSGERVSVQFLQELSPESPGYNPAWGKTSTVLPFNDPHNEDDRYDIGCFLVVKERFAGSGPENFKARALSTDVLGKDYGKEMADRARAENLDEPGWFEKKNFYITVAVEENGSVVRKVLSRGTRSDFWDELLDLNDQFDNSITGRRFIIKKGSQRNSPWQIQVDPNDVPMDVVGLEPHDLAKDAVRYIPYENQKEWYSKFYVPGGPRENNFGNGAPAAERQSEVVRSDAEKALDW